MNLNKSNNTNNIKDHIQFINQTQEDIVMDESRLILINGCAGSRKTDTLIKKGINYIISDKKNILFLTFVSSVSNEIKNRIEQTLNIQIQKIGSSNHFLSEYNSNYIEIANIDAWIHKQISWIETNLVNDNKYKINSCEFDKFIEDKLNNLKGKNEPINFNSRVILLKNYTEIYKFYNIVLKNDKFTDVILIDEFQDTDIEKVELIILLVKNNPNLFCVVAGDILQTIFINNIGCKNFINPINHFKNKLSPKYYEINTCFRCPAPQINFVNYLLGDKYKKYGLELMVSQNNDIINKPVLFGHDCISKNDTSYKLALSISNTIITIITLDKTIKPDDIAIMMKKSNSNFVFEHIKNILPNLYKKNDIVIDDNEPQLIHFETSGDGYSNSINWDKAKNKTVMISIHGDKGKGHKVVFFLGFSKKSIPSDYNMGKDFELIDISLLNVALTRSLKYLFIGFTFVSPSIYLSSKHLELDKYCYLAWDKNIKNKLAEPQYNVYLKSILQLNKFWFDDLKLKFKNPIFYNRLEYQLEYQLQFQSNKLPIKTNINVSQDISKDMVGFIEFIIPDLIVEKDYIDFYPILKIDDIPESFYKIFGFVGELLLMRLNMIQTNNFSIFGWILNSSIQYYDSDSLLNIIYDYKLNHFINDISLWKEKVIEIEFESILQDKNKDIIDLIQSLETEVKPQFILNKFYQKFQIYQYIKEFCSHTCNDKLYTNDVEKIILIALIYAEYNCEIRRDFIYTMVDKVLKLPDIKKIIRQIISNTQYVWDNFIDKKNIQFQKNISIEKKIKNENILKYYGFNYKTDKNVFSKGLKLNIGGICDLIITEPNNNNTNEVNLFELKTCLKTSFSNEWVLQIATYNILLDLVDNTKIKSNYIVNLFDGSIYEIKFNSNIQILKNILKLYDFDDYLLNFILS
jgi:superfamily I DNA/RNA helicase